MVSLTSSRFAAGRRTFSLVFSGVLLALVLACGAAYAASVEWTDAASLAKKGDEAGKPRLIYFYSDYCPYCKKMEKETLENEKVISYMNEHFIASRVNTQKEQKLAMEYMVRAVPTTVLIKADGTPVDALPGYISPDMFIWVLKYVDSKDIENMNFAEFLKKNGVESPMAKGD